LHELLAPIEIGIHKIFVSVPRSAGEFVEIGEVMRMHKRGMPRWRKNKQTIQRNNK